MLLLKVFILWSATCSRHAHVSQMEVTHHSTTHGRRIANCRCLVFVLVSASSTLYQFYSLLSREISRHQAEKAQVGLASLMLCPEVKER